MNEIIKYEDHQGNHVVLSFETVRKYLVNGQGNVTDQEIVMFLELCKYKKLNPFLREAYLIKYSDNQPANIVVSYEVFIKYASRHPKFRGFQADVEISKDGRTPLKAWCEVYIEGYQVPIKSEVYYQEYVGKKYNPRTGKYEVNRMWREKPITMLKKVAISQALRWAFPEELGGMYTVDEINTVDPDTVSTTPITPIDVEYKEKTESEQPEQPGSAPVPAPVKEEPTAEQTTEEINLINELLQIKEELEKYNYKFNDKQIKFFDNITAHPATVLEKARERLQQTLSEVKTNLAREGIGVNEEATIKLIKESLKDKNLLVKDLLAEFNARTLKQLIKDVHINDILAKIKDLANRPAPEPEPEPAPEPEEPAEDDIDNPFRQWLMSHAQEDNSEDVF